MSNNISPLNYLKNGWVNVSFANVAIYALLLMFILTLFTHAAIIASRAEVLHAYTEGKYSNFAEVIFQIRKGLALTQTENNEPCSNADLAHLREIKRTYYYLGDLGRTLNNQIICTIEHGIIEAPEELPPVHISNTDGIEYRNNQTVYFYNDENKPTITYQNVVLFISPVYLVLSKYGYTGVNGLSGVTYINGDKRYVFSYFGRLLPNELNHVIAYENSLWDWLPLPGKIIKKTRCSEEGDICMTAAYKDLGLYGSSDNHVSVALALIAISSIALGVIFEYFRVGPKSFVRKLKKQIQHNTIFPVYQPQVNIRTKKVIGVETLARWDDPALGLISPEVFISVAEDFKLIENLTKKLIIVVFHDLYGILEANPTFKVSINISADLLTSNNFVSFLNKLTSRYKFNRNQIVLEITERTVSNEGKMSEFSKKLQAQGYLVSIDDFGTGISNLSWLSMLEPNEIKVDKLFTHSIETQTVNSITLDGIFGMLEHLKVQVVFEGIETRQQREYICKKFPNAIGQGWLFAKPQKIDDLKVLLNV